MRHPARPLHLRPLFSRWSLCLSSPSLSSGSSRKPWMLRPRAVARRPPALPRRRPRGASAPGCGSPDSSADLDLAAIGNRCPKAGSIPCLAGDAPSPALACTPPAGVQDAAGLSNCLAKHLK